MNEKINRTEAMLNYETDPQRVCEIISKRLFQTRPRKEVENIPYMKCIACTADKPLGRIHINLKKLYPMAETGDVVYTDFNLHTDVEIEMIIRISAEAVLLKNEDVLYDGTSENEEELITVKLNKGNNIFSVKCECKPDKFGFSMMPSTKEYSFMWAKDLLFNIRNTIPIDEYMNEEGFAFSRVFKNFEKEEMSEFERGIKRYEYPKIKESTNEKDFNEAFADEKGQAAYALSYAKENGKAVLHFNSTSLVFVNDNTKIRAEANTDLELTLEKGDKVLVKSLREDKWGFSCDDEIFCMPHIRSCRKHGDKWLLIGTFGKQKNSDFAYLPENEINMKKPYYDVEKNRTFWRLADGSYIRPYLDTFFFGQWFYAIMVGHFGILKMYETFGDENLYNYFIKSMDIIASYYDYARYDISEFETNPSILPRVICLRELDPIGTVGMNLSEAYFYTQNADTLSVIRELENSLYMNVPKFEDGVIHRVKTMWTDDLFMGCPFLVRLGLLSGDKAHFDMAYAQFKGYKDRMFMEEEKIFSHIYFVEESEKSNVPWGRGNGWVMVALIDFLENVPKKYEHYDDVVKIFKEMSEGVVGVQDEKGMWHQVLNRTESFIESSCTAMFLYALSKGVTLGILDKKYIYSIEKAYKALIENFVDKDGNIYGVCMGSSCNRDWHYYSDGLNTIKNEDHGTGIILAAISAYSEVNK